MAFSIALFLSLISSPAALLAQSPSAEWRTIETRHFRVHYTPEYRDFATRTASQMEAIRLEVSEEVGFVAPQTVDVIVQNPLSQLNGEAIAPLAWPRIVLWAYPPEAGGELGTFTNWGELLAVHEETHIAHLLRPSRNRFRAFLSSVNPIALGPLIGAPRWVLEGFATFVEGKLTGSGRPNGALRQVILRTWARAGRLPTYRQLSSDSQNWLGMTMAYLAGSSFLEWLERRQGEGSLRLLWASMSARRSRSFDAAFRNVFGELPSVLYALYVAEFTHGALQSRLPDIQGEEWQSLSWRTERPDVSPDGSQLVTVLRSRTRPARLTLFSTLTDQKGEKDYSEQVDRMLELDPSDPRPLRLHPLPRKPLHELVRRDLRSIASPRFIGASGDVLFVAGQPDAAGDLHTDLYRWMPPRGSVDRLTRQADLKDPSVSEDGSYAVAVRTRRGKSQLVRVDLSSGAVSEMTPFLLEAPVDDPALSRDGRIAFVRNDGKGWKLMLLENGLERSLPVGDGTGDLFSPAFLDNETLLVTSSRHGATEIWRVPLAGPAVQQTRSAGASASPVSDHRGGFFFLGLDPDGQDIRHFSGEISSQASGELEIARGEVKAKPFAQQKGLPDRSYGLGRQEMLPLVGFSARPYDESSAEVLLRIGDIVGKLDSTIGASYGVSRRGVEGVAVRSVWRGTAVGLDGSLFHVGNSYDSSRRTGSELSAFREWHSATGVSTVRAGLALGRFEETNSRRIALRLSREGDAYRGTLVLPYSVSLNAEQGSARSESWTKFSGAAMAGVATNAFSVTGALGYHSGSGLPVVEQYQVGGARTTLETPLSFSSRLYAPELRRGALTASRVSSYEIELGASSFSSVRLFASRHEGRNDSGDSRSVDAFGLRSEFALGPMPLLKLPALSFTAGLARVDHHDTNLWAGVAWRP